LAVILTTTAKGARPISAPEFQHVDREPGDSLVRNLFNEKEILN
jgi:hypothetical protein